MDLIRRIEAESLNLAGYVTASKSFASGGVYIELNSVGSGTATTTFAALGDAPAGTYNITIGAYDESDGASQLTLYVDGQLVGTTILNQSAGGTRAEARNLRQITFQGVNLTPTSQIQLVGTLDAGEQARVDYLEFSLVQATGGGGTTPPANQSPDAVNDTASTTANTAVSIDVLGNDTDPDGNPLSITSVQPTSAQGGSVVVNSNGTLQYTPAANFSGTDAFTYTIQDGRGGQDTATVTVNVAPPVTPPPSGGRPATSLKVEAETMVLANGYEVESQTFASGGKMIRLNNNATEGSATITSFDNGSGVYKVTLVVHDESDGISTLKLVVDGQQVAVVAMDKSAGGTRATEQNRRLIEIPNITINEGAQVQIIGTLNSGEVARIDYVQFDPISTPTNRPPDAVNDTANTDANTAVFINVLGNDTDPDGNPLSITGVQSTSAQGGSVVVNSNGTLQYTPAANFSGTDTFTYTIQDGQGGQDTATITVNVAPPPSGGKPATSLKVEAENMVLANGYEVESQTFASGGKMIRLNNNATEGSATITSFDNGSGVYKVTLVVHDESDGISTLKLVVDGQQVAVVAMDKSAGGTRATEQNRRLIEIPNITINEGAQVQIIGTLNSGEVARIDYVQFDPISTPTNRPPDAVNDTANTDANTAVSINVLGNDTDPDGNPLSITGVQSTSAQGGSVVVNANGTVNYTPAEDFSGTDTFTYTIQDSQGGQDTATVTVTVAPLPTNPGTANYANAVQGIIANLNTRTVLKPVYGNLATPKIMALGDSITAGVHRNSPYPGAYRVQMWERFEEDGLVGNAQTVNFVGSQKNTNAPANLLDVDHEGHPGEKISYISSLVDGGLMSAYQPDAVLLMIGTNDAGGHNPSGMIKSLESLINKITAQSPETYLLVSTITPIPSDRDRGSVASSQTVAEYNRLIRELIPKKIAEGKRIKLVEAGGSLTWDDMLANDALHPTAAGYDKMGNTWYDSLIGKDAIATNVTNLVGSRYSDTLIGNGGNNILQGNGGDDILTGGGGSDTFAYTNPNQGIDAITDFGANDFFQILASAFGGGLTTGMSLASNTASSTGALVVGSNPTAVGNNANFLYNTSNGLLSFDVDGVGGQSAVGLAYLSNRPASLSVNQFQIV
ncbi:MAG: Ig-like domain-containing protein [Thainema sp.]